MEQMQDKEFDRLVREKLAGLTPTVPLGLWEKIEAGLQTNAVTTPVNSKKGNGILAWMGIAASLLILGFAWWMYQPAKVVYLKGPSQNAVSQTSNVQTEEAQEDAGLPIVKVVKAAAGSLISNKAAVRKTTIDETAQPDEKVVMLTEETEAPHAAIYPQLTKVSMQSAGTIENKPAIKQHLENVSLLAAADMPVTEEPTFKGNTNEESHVFGVSSILNFVVKSVDPGEKKVITFTEDREGTLNIGFNKFFASKKNK